MKRLAALALSLFSCLPVVHAAPRDPAPLPDDVVARLVREPFQKAAYALPREMATRLDETEDLIRRWEKESEAGQENAGRVVQLQAQAQVLTGLQDHVRQRLVERQTQAAAAFKDNSKGKKARAAAVKSHADRAARVEARFGQLQQVLTDVHAATTPAQRRQALKAARILLHQLRGQYREREEAPSAVPWPTARLGGASGQPPRQPVNAVPRYLAEQQTRYLNSVASNGPILLAVAPATPAEAGQCYTGGTVDSADLAATADAQKDDPEIVALAETLGHSPAKILAWVHDHIQYEPYWGSLKGAKGALVSGAGNATDQASLMIALLRASNIPARYVTGNIQINDPNPTEPGGRVLRWLGAKTYAAALQILGKARIGSGPATADIKDANNNLVTVNVGVAMEHVWVEACVPYSHYRGAAVSNAGHRWVPLDAAFKDKAYRQDVDVNVSFDYGFEAGKYLAARSGELPHEHFAKDVEAALTATGKDIADLVPDGAVKPMKLDILPASLPYIVTGFVQLTGASSVEPSSLPSEHRYALDVTVKSGATTLLARTVSYPDATLKRLSLSFTPADAASQTWWNAWDGSSATLPTSGGVNVKPVLKLEGVEVAGAAAGSASMTSGNLLTLILKLRLPDLDLTPACVADSGDGTDPDTTCTNKTVYDNIKPGGYHALGVNAFQTSDRYLKERAESLITAVRANPAPTPASPAAYDATLGEFLHLALMKYLRYMDDSQKLIGDAMNVKGLPGNDIGLTTVDLKTEYLLDQPYAVRAGGLLIDVKGGQSRLTKLDSSVILQDTDTPEELDAKHAAQRAEIWPAFKLATYAGSTLEHYIWQEMARTDAVSTVRGLQYARETGSASDILTFTSANIAQYDSLMDVSMAAYKNQIVNHVNGGATVTVPKKKLAYSAEGTGEVWNGAVYMAENQIKGSITAAISGSFGGGWGAVTAMPQTFSFNTNYATFDVGIPSQKLGTDLSYFSIYNSSTLSDGRTVQQTMSADPVNMVTGNLYHVERDLSIAGRGGLPLVFERSYNSRRPKDGPLGWGWTHSFNHALKFYGVEGGLAKVGWLDGSGAEKYFGTTSHASGNIAVGTTLANPDGVFVTFKREANGQYTVKEKNGLGYTFESLNGTATDTSQKAKLLTIADRNGNTLTLAYNPDGTLKDVTDGVGRKLALTYTGSHLTQIDFKQADGTVIRSHQYSYDAAGNLISHLSPATLADPAKNPPVSYQYYSEADGQNLGHAMKKYLLPRGNGMAFHYYQDGRVFRHAAFGPDGADLGQETSFRYNTYRRETVQINERGLTRTFLFDANGSPVSVTEENGATRSYAYDAAHPMNRTSKTDPYGLTTQYQYDSLGNVTQITNPDGNVVRYYDFTVFNQPRRIQDARGNWTLLRYDPQGNLTDEVKLKAGVAPVADTGPAAADVLAWSKIQYDAHGNRTATKRLKSFSATLGDFASGSGPTVTTNYDTNALYPVSVSRVGDKDGDGTNDAADTETLAFDPQGRQTRGLDADWQVVQSQYDAVDRVIRATDALGLWRDYQFDANGNPIEQSLTIGSARVDASSAQYDGADRQILAIDAGGHASTWDYDARGNALKITDPDGYHLAFEYDAMDRWTTAYDKAGNSVSRELDISGRVRSVTDPNGHAQTSTWWDASRNGRQKEQIDALGRKTTHDWDANGNPISVTDNLNQTSKTFYDALNRPVRQVGPLTNGAYPVTCTKYDALGNLAEIWAGTSNDPNATSCDLSGADANLKKQLTALWNDFGGKVTETDPLGHVQTWRYDRHGNVTQYTDAKGQTRQYTWDPGHQLKTRTAKQADGTVYQTLSYTRNALGQVENVTQSNPALTETTTYDAAHRAKTISDSRGGKTLTHDWSPGGLLNYVEDGDGHRTDYLYDGVGRLIGIWAPNYDYVVFTHDAGGRLTERWYPNGVTARYTWNADDSLALLENRTAANNLLSSHAYQYDDLGRRHQHTETIRGLGTHYLQYGFDPLSRLTQVQSCDASYTLCATDEATSYDAWDNRATQTKGGATLAYVHDAAHQLTEIRQDTASGALTTGLVYDANGNLIKKCSGGTVTRGASDCTGSKVISLAFNPLDQLAYAQQGTTSEAHAYDPQGRRIQTTKNAVATNYLYQGPDIAAEYGPGWGAPTAVYSHGPAWDDPVIRLTGATASPEASARYYAQDGQGNVVAWFGELGVASGPIAASDVSATHSFDATNYPASKLIDGEGTGSGGFWAGASSDLALDPPSITLELGSSQTVSRIKLYPVTSYLKDYIPQDAEVQVRDSAGAWRLVGVLHHGVDDSPEIPLAGATGTALRVLIQGTRGGVNLVLLAEVALAVESGATEAATQRFDAWGQPLQAAGATIPRYGYQGREPSDPAIGLIYYRNRYYDPEIGRFISRDPSGMPDGVNRYAFVRNAPVLYTDPMGLRLTEPMEHGNQTAYTTFTGERINVTGPAVLMTRAAAAPPGTITPGFTNLKQSRPQDGILTTPAEQPRSLAGAIEGFVNGAVNGLKGAVSNPGEFINWATGGAVFNEGGDGGDVTKRPSRVRKGTEQSNWDNAQDGESGGKLCPTCGKEVTSRPGEKGKDWDNDHVVPWRDRDLSGKDRKEVLDEYNRDTRLRCVSCNRSDNGN